MAEKVLLGAATNTERLNKMGRACKGGVRGGARRVSYSAAAPAKKPESKVKKKALKGM